MDSIIKKAISAKDINHKGQGLWVTMIKLLGDFGQVRSNIYGIHSNITKLTIIFIYNSPHFVWLRSSSTEVNFNWLSGLAMGIRCKAIARLVVTTVTLALLANAMPANWRFVAAARPTYKWLQVTLSHKYLYSAPVMTVVIGYIAVLR